MPPEQISDFKAEPLPLEVLERYKAALTELNVWLLNVGSMPAETTPDHSGQASRTHTVPEMDPPRT